MLAPDKIARKIRARFGWKLMFDESIKSLIDREGVFSTRGSRPLFSTI